MDEQDRAWQVDIESLDDRIHKLDERLSTLERLTPAIELIGLLGTARRRLMEIMAIGTHVRRGDDAPPYCNWCGKDAEPTRYGFDLNHHEPLCPYVATKAFLADLESKL